MTLVERFIEFSHWPTSRKGVYLGIIILPFHLLGWLIWHLAQAELQIIDMRIFDVLSAAWTGVVVLWLAMAWLELRAGRDGRWTGYLFGVMYNTVLIALVYGFGSTSSFLIALPCIVVLFLAVYFDEPIARIALLFSLGLYLLVGILEGSGVLPYAPILLERSVDTQNNPIWFGITLYVVAIFLVVAYLFIAAIIATRELQETRLRGAQKLIRRYVPSQVADRILSGESESVDHHERRKLTIFLSDLMGFTDIAEEMEPEDLSRVLNQYFSEMTAIANRHGGTVDELSGDAILVFFGAPVATHDKDHALRAVRMAAEMQQAVVRLNEGWRKAGVDVVLRVRMGISTGVVTIGNFGSPDRMKYAALGKHVILAARLQAQCEPGKVWLSHATWLLVSDQVQCAPKGEMQFKGINRPVAVYELVIPQTN